MDLSRKGAPWPLVFLTATSIVLGVIPWSAQGASQTPSVAPDVEVLWEHLAFMPVPDGLRIVHVTHVLNRGPRPALRVPLGTPRAIRWVEFPAPLVPADGMIVDPRPLAVGEERQYALVYDLPTLSTPWVVRRPLLYFTNELWLWTESPELSLRALHSTPVGTEESVGAPSQPM